MCLEPLRVAIFPYIPDIANDKLEGLKRFIVDEYKKRTGEQVEIFTDADPYNLEYLGSKYLGEGPDAYDVMEVDTILLGEIVNTGNLQPLDDHFTVTEEEFAPSAVHSVTLSSRLYGVPTLLCASFLMELADKDHHTTTPLLKDWSSFDQLKKVLTLAEDQGNKMFLAGDFRGSWELPKFYLEGYVDHHDGKKALDGTDGPLDDDLIKDIGEFIDFGKLQSGKNPGSDGTFHDHHDKLVNEVVDSKHILLYAYSENMGETLQKAIKKDRRKHTLAIVSPPLGDSNHLLTYTDAAVVNKHRFANPKKAPMITKFVEFYTSLAFRTSFALGKDLVSPEYPRYVLPARKAFYTEAGAKDKYYREFHFALIEHSVAGPNHGIYFIRKDLQKKLENSLGMTPKAHSQLK